MVDKVVEFAGFLNSNGYMVTEKDIERFLSSQTQGFDIVSEAGFVGASRLFFAKNRAQYEMIPEASSAFIKDSDREGAENRFKKQLGDSETELQKKRIEIDDKTKSIEKEEQIAIQTFKSVYKDTKESKCGEIIKGALSDKDFLHSAGLDDKEINELDRTARGLASSLVALKDIAKKLSDAATQAMMNLDTEKFGKYHDLYDAVQHFIKHKPSVEEEKLRKSYEAKKTALATELKKEEEAHRKTQEEINKALKDLSKPSRKWKTVVKDHAVTHREGQFIGRNAVQTVNELPEFANKNINTLTDHEREELYTYIRKHLIKFKTRMTRNIRTVSRKKPDIAETIRNACRTGGVPFEICYEKPARNKADLILILDVSGSCSRASEIMMTLIGLLKTVFPRGCKAYAFVNSLYDITDAFDSGDIDKGVKTALRKIPTKGVYSDYYTPFKDFWENHQQEITKDSTVIFIGDARNNKNPTGEEYIKNISRRAKRAYFLNTEHRKLWDTADSLASLYSRYAKMYETVNIDELIGFISSLA